MDQKKPCSPRGRLVIGGGTHDGEGCVLGCLFTRRGAGLGNVGLVVVVVIVVVGVIVVEQVGDKQINIKRSRRRRWR